MSDPNSGMAEEDVRQLALAYERLRAVRERWKKILLATNDPGNRINGNVSAIMSGVVYLGPILLPIKVLDLVREQEERSAEDMVRERGGQP